MELLGQEGNWVQGWALVWDYKGSRKGPTNVIEMRRYLDLGIIAGIWLLVQFGIGTFGGANNGYQFREILIRGVPIYMYEWPKWSYKEG